MLFRSHNSLITAFGNDFTKPEYSLGVIYIIRDPRNVITSVKNHNDLDSYDQALKFMQDENKVLEDYPHLKNYAKTNIVNSCMFILLVPLCRTRLQILVLL